MRPTMAAVARLVDGKRSLNGIMRDSELSRLETLSALEDLLVTGHIRFAPETLGERISESLPPPTRKPTMPAHFSLQPREDAPDPVPGLTEDMATPKAKDVTTAPPPRGDTSGDTYPALEGELGKSVPLSAIVDQDVRSDFDEAERPTLADPFEVERQLELTRQAASGASTPTAPAIAEDPTPPSAEERPSPPAGTEARATTSEPPAGSGRSEPPPSSERPPRSEPAPPEEEDRDSEPDPQASSRRSRTASAPPAAHRRTLYAVTAVAALSTTAAVYFGLSASQPDPTLVPVPVTTAAEAAATPSTAPAPGTATATSAPSASAAPAPELVRLRIDLTPDYARVYLDGKRVRPPYDYSLPKDDGTRIIRIEAPGHKARKVTYVAREDLRLVIALEPLPRLEKPTTDPVKPEASPPDPY